jgi:glycosyltransferase involved in cell wall biosynthesis
MTRETEPTLGCPLSVVVPCYNEQDNLARLYERITSAALPVVGPHFEIVLVNDGSRDQTWHILKQLAARDPRVVAVNLSRNHGHQLALSAGLSLCTGERVFILDADLQDPPELLGAMMEAMDEGADVVYGRRTHRPGESWFKRWSARAFYRVMNRLTDTPIPMDTGDFRLMSRRVLDVLNAMPEQHRFVRGMVSWVGFRQVPLEYERERREHGTSNYPLRKMLRLAMDAVTSFSTRPLRIASLFGLSFAALGMLGVCWSVGGWLVGAAVPGWTSVMVVMLVLGGVQLAVIGILGEYLGRLYMEVKRRPLYVIEEVYRTRSQDVAGAASRVALTAEPG